MLWRYLGMTFYEFLMLLVAVLWGINLCIRSFKGRQPTAIIIIDRFFNLIKFLMKELNSGNLIQRINAIATIMLVVLFLGTFGMFLFEHFKRSLFPEKLFIITASSFISFFPTMLICAKFTRPRYHL